MDVPPNYFWKTIPGWFTDLDNMIYMGAISRYGKYAKFAEIGVWKGRSFASVLPLATQLGYKQAVAVDTFTGSASEIQGPHAEALTTNIRQIFETNISQLNHNNFVNILQFDSARAAMFFPDEYFDLVFIDAEHTYEAVTADITAWLPKIKVGGTLIGHDWIWPNVRQAVIDTLTPLGKQHVCENMWWFFKK